MWVLIVVLFASGWGTAGKSVATQEFGSEQTCEAAKRQVVAFAERELSIKAICMPKG